MDSASFSEIQKTRFLAMNFSRLQGLRAVPTGLLLFLVTLWGNTLHGPARDFILPGSAVVVCGGLYILVDRYYQQTFGHVVASSESRRADLALSIIGGLVGLAAFLVDVQLKPPVSFIGLVFAAAFVWEYIRMVLNIHRWYIPLMPFFGLLIAVFSLLPALGLGGWWQQIGVKSELLGVCMVVGAVMLIAGLLSHLYFIRALPQEPRHD